MSTIFLVNGEEILNLIFGTV